MKREELTRLNARIKRQKKREANETEKGIKKKKNYLGKESTAGEESSNIFFYTYEEAATHHDWKLTKMMKRKIVDEGKQRK